MPRARRECCAHSAQSPNSRPSRSRCRCGERFSPTPRACERICERNAAQRLRRHGTWPGVGRFGGLDAVLANAGTGSWASLLGMDPGEFARVIDVNPHGVFHTVRAALPALIDCCPALKMSAGVTFSQHEQPAVGVHADAMVITLTAGGRVSCS